ncbi:MAG: glycosyltransferase family 9 protein [Kiritimatiellales bacterium]
MRILIVKTSSLGDLFHALPAVHLLKTGLNAEIDWVVNSSYVPLVKCFTDVDRVIPFPRNNVHGNLKSFLADLRQDKYDLVVDMQGLLKSALIARAARSHKRIGPSFHREFAYLFYDHVAAERNKERHAVDENLDVLRFLELPTEPVQFPVAFPPPEFVGQTSPLKILLSPCSRHAAKNWPVERFAAVGKVLHEKTGAMLYISGVPEDADTCKKLMELLPPGSAHNLCGKTSLVELGGVLQAMALVITVDSGPMHMAAATGTPTLAIFGPTDPLRVGPFGPQHRVLRNTGVTSYSKDDLKSILGVSVEDAVRAAEEMLAQCVR